MPDYEKLIPALEKRGFAVRHFATAAEAADFLDAEIDGTTVGFGGSLTAEQMDLYPRLSRHNTCFWHWKGNTREEAAEAEVYISSVNGLAETGELINIDGTGNRVAATLSGHREVYLVAGSNKIAPDFEGALWRARNIAAPKNAQRLGAKTPCALRGDRCYDCDSPGRICRGLVVLWCRPRGIDRMTVVLVDEELGL